MGGSGGIHRGGTGAVTGKVVNLRQFRKRRERADGEAEPDGNRARRGRTKAERLVEESRRDAADRAHDGRRLDADAQDAGPDNGGPASG